MSKKGTVVLEGGRIDLIIKRFAHRIVEDHHTEKEIVLVGISGNGTELSTRMATHLKRISSQKIILMELGLNKEKPLSTPIEFSSDPTLMKARIVILVDDVLNSGKTLVHALAEILKYDVKGVNTFVLVDRIHRSYPVKADHVGMSLSTTIQERVEVELSEKEDYAYLT